MALFFVLACLAAWFALFDDARARLWAWMCRQLQATSGWSARTFQAIGRRLAPVSRPDRQPSQLMEGIRTHRYLLLAMVVLIALPPLLVLMLRHEVVLDGFEVVQRPASSTRIEELLRGERLVPPPPPPPEVFMTAEVEAVRPMTATADRKWDQLDADFAQRLLAVYRVMHEQHGYEMVLVEGYRSADRQNQLAARGRHVTQVRGNRSWHQYGLAADSAFLRDGKLVISERDPWAMRGYQLYGQVAKEAGLGWGGDWRTIKDLMHVELRRAGVMKP
ncbi:MAG: M15 family metallopeptidase [Pseudoxanthomonas sp.]